MTGFPLTLPLDVMRARAIHVIDNSTIHGPSTGFSIQIEILSVRELTAVKDFVKDWNAKNAASHLTVVAS